MINPDFFKGIPTTQEQYKPRPHCPWRIVHATCDLLTEIVSEVSLSDSIALLEGEYISIENTDEHSIMIHAIDKYDITEPLYMGGIALHVGDKLSTRIFISSSEILKN